jgi:hypothetical protein
MKKKIYYVIYIKIIKNLLCYLFEFIIKIIFIIKLYF